MLLTQATKGEQRTRWLKTWCLFYSWANSEDVWIKMLNKEQKYVHDKGYLQRHPKLQPKMRAILLDWLLEVRAELNLEPEDVESRF